MAPSWPTRKDEQIRQIITSGSTLVDMRECSPIRFDSDEPATEAIVDQLFTDNPLLCCGRDIRRCKTKRRNEWRGQLSGKQFIVPSPMRTKKGKTVEGKLSFRSLDNTDERRFLVVEFDFPQSTDFNEDNASASLLLHLAQYAPLALVVHSDGNSLHGWFYCHGQQEPKLQKFMQYAVSLGADPAMWTRCQTQECQTGCAEVGKDSGSTSTTRK